MADFRNNPGNGQLFKNTYKTEDKHPDYKGKMTDPSGKEWDLSAWLKTGQNGKFLSIAIQEPYVKPNDAPKTNPDDFDDDIPF